MNSVKRISLLLACLLALGAGTGCTEDDTTDDTSTEEGTGGSTTSTGGDDSSTGGDDSSTGGDDSSTGGMDSSTGGDDSSTGGTDSSTGGDDSSTGGMDATTGGDLAGTGGDDMTGDSAMFCIEECTQDSDCTVSGVDSGLTCIDGYCSSDSTAGGCSSDDDCVATFSGWITACTMASECPGQVCTEAGFCATAPNGFTCVDVGMSDFATKDIDGVDVTVCANTDYTCSDEGVCENPCEADSECTVAGYSKCMDNGACGCADDADCQAAGFAVCLDNGTCGCATDDDCTATEGADTCYDGVCGCSADSVCGDTAFDGTTVSCKSL